MATSVLIGFGIGWLIMGLVNLVFSSKKLTRKLDKKMSNWEIEDSCFKNKIGAIFYLTFGTTWLILGLICLSQK